MNQYKEIKEINTKENFNKFIDILIKDFKNNSQEWENKSIDDYLESIQS